MEKRQMARPELPEKDFIHEDYPKNPYPLWIALLLLALVIIATWYFRGSSPNTPPSPPHAITNRELSLFLWENPHYMRAHTRHKTGYLTAFQYLNSKVTVEPEMADLAAVAPPQLLDKYRLWKRLLYPIVFSRTIAQKEFQEFLSDAEEWQPQYWAAAPGAYQDLVGEIATGQSREGDLQQLSQEILPLEVRKAFQGWKNYTKEGSLINEVHPTFEEMERFLAAYPAYACVECQDSLPDEAIAPFLKVGFYNWLMTQRQSPLDK
jgi:hypothetical protein